MNRPLMLACVLCGAAAISIAQTAPADQPNSPAAGAQSGVSGASPASTSMGKPQADTSAAAQKSAGPAIPVTLAKSVDSKKAKAGDEIDAKTSVSMSSATGVQIPEGTKVVGHITDAKAKGKGDPESSLAFSFEKIVLKNGQEMPFHAVAQAIGVNTNAAAAAFPENGGPNSPQANSGIKGGASPAVGSGPGANSTPGAAAGTSNATPNGVAAQDPNTGHLSPNATGVVGIKGLTLNSQANGTVLLSDSKSVKLDSGTEMLLRVISQ